MRYFLAYLFAFFCIFSFIPNAFAQYGTFSISGYLFNDQNLNGSYDAGEPIIHNDSNPFGITSTPLGAVSYPSSGRSYQIANNPAGNITVYLDPPLGYIPYYPNNANPPFHTVKVGPGCSAGTGSGHGASCSSGSVGNLNFALQRINKVQGRVYQDKNQNGTYDNGTDIGLSSQSVTITDNSGTGLSACPPNTGCTCSSSTCTATTDVNGVYLFGPLFHGTYTVAYTALPATPTQEVVTIQ